MAVEITVTGRCPTRRLASAHCPQGEAWGWARLGWEEGHSTASRVPEAK